MKKSTKYFYCILFIILIIIILLVKKKNNVIANDEKNIQENFKDLMSRDTTNNQAPSSYSKCIKLNNINKDDHKKDIKKLEEAVNKNDTNEFYRLLNKKCMILNDNIIFVAIDKNNIDMIKIILDKFPSEINKRNDRGVSVFYKAYLNKNKAIMDLLFSRGVNINEIIDPGFFGQIDNTDGTIIYIAFNNMNIDMIDFLLSRGADINKGKIYSMSPLSIFSGDYHNIKKVKLLLDKGANVNSRDYYDNTPLINATKKGEYDTVLLLLNHGANINAKNKEGYTAYSIANSWIGGNKDIAKLLKERGAITN